MRRRGSAVETLLLGAVAAAVALLAGATALAGSAREQNPPAEQRLLPYSGTLPECADSIVFGEIASGFAHRESGYWDSPLAIVSFERVSETGYRSHGRSYIPRRYCEGEALFNDGRRREVVYNIGESLGMFGIGSGVTWCVQGLDRNHAFSPNCKVAGP